MRITLNIENRIDYYANTPWTTRLQIRDSAGRSVNITVTITAPRNLVISTSSVSIQNWNTTTFTIKDGNGWYTTTSNNTSIATVSLNWTTATITARAVWSTTITVRDRLWRQINLPVTITAKPLTLDKTSITIDEKTSGYINITNGNGWYSVTRNNANVSVHPNGSTGYRVYGEKVWSSILNIKDSAGKVVSVSVVVRENIKNLVVTWFNQSRNWVEWEIINFTTTSWNGNYTITSSNTNVASVSINSTLWNGSITLKTPGSTTITLKDGKAKSVSMNIWVLPILKNIEYTSQVEDGYLWWMYYEVENNNLIKETWIEYRYLDSSNRVTKQWLQNIPKNTDVNERSYAAFIVPNCNSACVIEVRAYVKTASNVTIYKNNWVWWKINYGVKLLTSASTLKVANNEEEDVFSWETDDRKEEEEYIEDDIAWYEERVDRENSWESIESEYSEEKEETYEEEYSEEEEWVEVNAVFTTFLVVLSFVWLVAVLSSFDDMQPVFPVMKLKPLFAGINPLKNVLQINSKAHLDWLAGKAWVWASKIYNASKITFIKKIKFDIVQLQKKYSDHALDFWINWNYNTTNRELFKNAILNHSSDSKTDMILGTYRTTIKVQHFYNQNTWINVMYDLDWNFISWWKLWKTQIDNLLRNGNIQ